MSVQNIRTYTVQRPRTGCSTCGSKAGPQEAEVNKYDGHIYTWRTCPFCHLVYRWAEPALTDFIDADEGIGGDMLKEHLREYAPNLEAALTARWQGWSLYEVHEALAAVDSEATS